MNDALTHLERSGISLLRTWQRAAVSLAGRTTEISVERFCSAHEKKPSLRRACWQVNDQVKRVSSVANSINRPETRMPKSS
jgi:hypothetical protein